MFEESVTIPQPKYKIPTFGEFQKRHSQFFALWKSGNLTLTVESARVPTACIPYRRYDIDGTKTSFRLQNESLVELESVGLYDDWIIL